MRKKIALVIFVIVITALITYLLKANVQNKTSAVPSGKISIAASFYPVYFFASQIGGVKADVFTITPAGTEPHDYEPTTQDIAKISDSKLLVINGGNLEPWADRVKQLLNINNVVIASDSIAKDQLNQDSHFWLDPELAKVEASNIEKGFERIDPDNAAYYRSNLDKLVSQLTTLDQQFKLGLQNCQLKDFITSHAAFGYLASQYNLNQIAISGISPDEEPSSQKIAQIADLVKKENVKIIFFESLVSPKLSETIAKETNARTMKLDPLEGLTDNDIKAGKNYFSVMDDNLKALQTALICTK